MQDVTRTDIMEETCVIGLGERALEHARVLARRGRGSATQAEAEAARYVQEAAGAIGDRRCAPAAFPRAALDLVVSVAGFRAGAGGTRGDLDAERSAG